MTVSAPKPVSIKEDPSPPLKVSAPSPKIICVNIPFEFAVTVSLPPPAKTIAETVSAVRSKLFESLFPSNMSSLILPVIGSIASTRSTFIRS